VSVDNVFFSPILYAFSSEVAYDYYNIASVYLVYAKIYTYIYIYREEYMDVAVFSEDS
jgi:hypothetical protein